MSTALSASQIAGFLKWASGQDAGNRPTTVTPIDGRNATIAIAIALAESGGRVDAKGGPNSNGTYDWGLWQINEIHKPSQFAKEAIWPNWQMAYSISGNGTNWRPWSTFKNGKYLPFMGAAATAWQTARPISAVDVDKSTGIPVGGAVNDPATISTSPLAIFDVLTQGETWVRVAMAIAGVMLILIATAGLISKGALNFSPIGKIAKAAGVK